MRKQITALFLSSFLCGNVFAVSTYTNKADFLNATGSTQLTSAYGNHALGGYSYVPSGTLTSGSLQFTGISAGESNSTLSFSQSLLTTNFTTVISGDEIAFSGEESMKIESLGGALFSLGFDFYEPSRTYAQAGNTHIDSTNTSIAYNSEYTVSLFNGAALVASVLFSPVDDQLAFFGVSSLQTFDKVSIIESASGIAVGAYDANIDNEFYGQFYGSSTAVTEPSILALLGVGLLSTAVAVRRR